MPLESINSVCSQKISKYYQKSQPESDSSQWRKLSDKVSRFVSDLLAYLDLESMIPLWSLMPNYYKNQEIEELRKKFKVNASALKSFEKELIKKGTLDEGSRPSRTILKAYRYPLCLQFTIFAHKWTFTDWTLAALPVVSWIQNYQKNRFLYFYGHMSRKAEVGLENLKKHSQLNP